MKSEDAMVVWTPDRDPFLRQGTRGLVAVTTVPEKAKTEGYALSIGACDLGWREKLEQERQQALDRIASQMIVKDNIRSEDVEKAFSQIEGWRGGTGRGS